MTRKTIIYILALVFLPFSAMADDTDIYGVSTIDVEPNVLILLDNSASMTSEDVETNAYDPDTTYTADYTSDSVYYKANSGGGGGWNRNSSSTVTWTLYFSDVSGSGWKCTSAQTSLLEDGYVTTNLSKSRDESTVTCASGQQNGTEYRLGNYLNWLAETGGSTTEARMKVAKNVVGQLIYDNIDSVRFGLMAFNPWHSVNNVARDEGGYLVAPVGSSQDTLIGDYDPDSDSMTEDVDDGYGKVGSIEANTSTPLAEALAEAGLYYAGKTSWYNGGDDTSLPYDNYLASCFEDDTSCSDYSELAVYDSSTATFSKDTTQTGSPIQYRCQKNYIIIITDGEPYLDDDDKLASHTYMDGEKVALSSSDSNNLNTSHYLDDVAYFLANHDLRDDLGSTGDYLNQTVVTYTIGFQSTQELLAETAENGDGAYYTSTNATDLNEALTSILTSINANSQGFSTAAVPVSSANDVYAGNYIYYGLFQPVDSGRWVGNLKKYYITDSGTIEDVNGDACVSDGVVDDTAQSYWSTDVDGSSVEDGGAGSVLEADLASSSYTRNVYTYLGTSTDLTDSSNAFTTDNTDMQSSYSVLTSSVIAAVRHDDGTWPYSSMLHSDPLVESYDDDTTVIYVGANDGMLHAINDKDGSELWGYIPTDLLSNLSVLEDEDSLNYFVDGSPVLYDFTDSSNNEKKYLIFGERRGGSAYTCLDVTAYSSPAFAYTITSSFLSSTTLAETLGQSWSKPDQVSMLDSNGDATDVFLFAGGYDTNQDDNDGESDTVTADTTGRAIFAVNAQNGTLLSNFAFSYATYSDMSNSIVAVAGFENPKSTNVTRIYAGDMDGNLFAFRDDIFHYNTDDTLNDYGTYGDGYDGYDGQEDGTWGQKLKLFSTEGQKIFYAPNILSEYFKVNLEYTDPDTKKDVTTTAKRAGDYVYYGTGDRAHPTRTDIHNGLYAIKNSWDWDGSESPTIIQAYIETDTSSSELGDVKSVNSFTYNGTTYSADTIILDAKYYTTSDQDNESSNYVESTDSGFAGYDITIDVNFLLDETDDIYQTSTGYNKKYVTKAIASTSNKGWFINFCESDGSWVGEKMMSTPVIYDGILYFTTYIPDSDSSTTSTDDDPCASTGASGDGYLWEIGYEYGEASANNTDDGETVEGNNTINSYDRKILLSSGGIPAQPQIVVQADGASVITGMESTPVVSDPKLKPLFWRKLDSSIQ